MNTILAGGVRRHAGRASASSHEASRRPIPKEDVLLGSHVVTARRGYLHHGIYVGAGRVVHYAGLANGLHRGPVEETSLAGFARGRTVRVKSGAPARFARQEVIDRARSRVGENDYRLLTNNCEHLCEWCLHGMPRSYQVEALLARPIAALRAMLWIAVQWTRAGWAALERARRANRNHRRLTSTPDARDRRSR